MQKVGGEGEIKSCEDVKALPNTTISFNIEEIEEMLWILPQFKDNVCNNEIKDKIIRKLIKAKIRLCKK